MAMLRRYRTKRLSPALEVKVSEVASTPSITLPFSFLPSIVALGTTSHPRGLVVQNETDNMLNNINTLSYLHIACK